jgi:uncharacterized membrane protein YhiD involved in acid resistance
MLDWKEMILRLLLASLLGGGAILLVHRTEMVRGVTTVAGLWTVAAMGLAADSGN